MPNHPVIERVEVDAYTVPTDQPEEDGTLAWDETTIVLVHAHAGDCTGLGYTYADVATAKLIESKLGRLGARPGRGCASPRLGGDGQGDPQPRSAGYRLDGDLGC